MPRRLHEVLLQQDVWSLLSASRCRRAHPKEALQGYHQADSPAHDEVSTAASIGFCVRHGWKREYQAGSRPACLQRVARTRVSWV